MSVQTLSPEQFLKILQSQADVDLIDVRTPAEYGEVHVSVARNVPLDRLDPQQVAQMRKSDTQPLYVICRSGARSRQACEKLMAAGIQNVVSIEGGTSACEAARVPVARSGAKVMSLERQVRIAAGLLVLTGIAVGHFVHPAGYGLSAFVGAGLVFAGVTDTCGMGMLLARMPWNQNSVSCSR